MRAARGDGLLSFISAGARLAGRLTNFEIYGDNPERLAAFYRELLAWRIERAEGVDY